MQLRSIFTLVIAMCLASASRAFPTRTRRSGHRSCSMTMDYIRGALDQPCSQVTRGRRHERDVQNVCFFVNGRVVSSLEAMLHSHRHSYKFNEFDMDFVMQIRERMNLSTHLHSNVEAGYITTMRKYFTELSCLSLAMERSEVTHTGRRNNRRICHIVKRYVRPMLCEPGSTPPREPLDPEQMCSNWSSSNPSHLRYSLYAVIWRFEQFLESLPADCGTMLPLDNY